MFPDINEPNKFYWSNCIENQIPVHIHFPKNGHKGHHTILENTGNFNFPGELYWSADKGVTKPLPAKVGCENWRKSKERVFAVALKR